MAKEYYEFKDATSSKFWEIDTKGSTVTVRFGKIGTDGQTTVKKFASPAEAKEHAAKATSEKLKKGYKKRKAEAPSHPSPQRPSPKKENTKTTISPRAETTAKSQTGGAAKAPQREVGAEMSTDITIRLALTKGDGHFPKITQFSDAELRDMKSCLSLNLSWDPDASGLGEGITIKSAEILYDGVSPLPGEKYGYRVSSKSVSGYPAPVIRFQVNRPVPPKQFLKAVWTSSVALETAAMIANDEDPFFAEDHNGYSSVVSDEDRDELIGLLKRHKLLSGRLLKFRGGIPEDGYSVPGASFIVKCGRA